MIEPQAESITAIGADNRRCTIASIADWRSVAGSCRATAGNDASVACAAIFKPDNVVGRVGNVEVVIGVHVELLRPHIDGVAQAGRKRGVAGGSRARCHPG